MPRGSQRGPDAYLMLVARAWGGGGGGGVLARAQVYHKVQGLTLLYGIGVFSRMRAENGLKG